MAKTIKFNLVCDDKPVRTIEDLQNNFSIEDVLAYYNNKLLHRWLEVRGYKTELDKVSKIESTSQIDIVKELIKIFDITCDNAKTEQTVFSLDYLEERKNLFSDYQKNNFEQKNVINDYLNKYQSLCKEILDNPDNVSLIKANIAEILANYKQIFALDYRKFFYDLFNSEGFLAIFCLLMKEDCRDYFLPKLIQTDDKESDVVEETFPNDDVDSDVVYETLDGPESMDKKEIYKKITSLLASTSLTEKLGSNLHKFAGVTDGYWKDLETSGKYMILKIESGDYVRSAGNNGGDLSKTDITDHFLILDGIDYKSNNASRELWYMEV